MYKVTIDLAAPAENATITVDAANALGAELEKLVLRHGRPGPVRRLETVVSPAGVIFAVTVDTSSEEKATLEANDLISRSLAGTRFAGWPIVGSDAHPVAAEPHTSEPLD